MVAPKSQVNVLPVSVLRSASLRISYATEKDLPYMLPGITSDLAVCSTLLANTLSLKNKKGSEESVTVHHFTTVISTLLQDRAVERRWAGIVLVKAAIEHGKHGIVQNNIPWIKHLMNFLCKPNPSTIYQLTVLTLTRIFLLIHDHPALVRELATPSLPPFVTACLDVLKQNAVRETPDLSLVPTIFESFGHLLPLHSTVFRPFQSQMRDLLRPLIAPTSSDLKTEDSCVSAQRLFVQLHRCAPKAGVAEEWQSLLSKTVGDAHDTADLVFRSLIEFWQTGERPRPAATPTTDIEVQSNTSPLQLLGWTGIQAGCERLVQLLTLLKCFFILPNSSPTSCKVGQVLTLAQRIFLLRVPSSEDEKHGRDHLYNVQVPKEELMGLLSKLPSIHTSALDLVVTVVDRLGVSLMSTLATELLGHVARLFETEKQDLSLRTTSYRLVRALLEKKGAIIDQDVISLLSPVITECSLDCLAARHGLATRENRDSKSIPRQEQSVSRENPRELQQAALALLPMLLAKLPTNCVLPNSRYELDEAAVLSCNQQAILASVLNPQSKSNLLPFLARTSAAAMETEAILRPRLPPTTMGPGGLDGVYEDWTGREKSDDEMDEKGTEESVSDEGKSDEGESDDGMGDKDTEVASTSMEASLGKRKRVLEKVQIPARSVNEDQGNAIPSEHPPGVTSTANSEKIEVGFVEATAPQMKSKSRPSKRVRFSDPEAELLGQSAPLAHVDEPEKPTPAKEDEDDFEIPPLTIEQDSDEEAEG